MKRYLLCLLAIFLLAVEADAQILQLITDDEARLPASQEIVEQLATRGITRGPGISLASPDVVVRQGFPLRIVFEPRGGTTIDPESVRIVYLKSPLVELTARLKGQISPTGVDVPVATAPVGEHLFQVTVKDSNGHQTIKKINLAVR
jgi:hypothetical protein